MPDVPKPCGSSSIAAWRPSRVQYRGVPDRNRPNGYRSVGRSIGPALSAREEIRRALLSSIGADVETGGVGDCPHRYPDHFDEEWESARVKNLAWATEESDRLLLQARLCYLSPSATPMLFVPPSNWDRHASFALGEVTTIGRQSEFEGEPLMIAEDDLAVILKEISPNSATIAAEPEEADDEPRLGMGNHDEWVAWCYAEWKASGFKGTENEVWPKFRSRFPGASKHHCLRPAWNARKALNP